MKYVYLCGPIGGMTMEEAAGWRREVLRYFHGSEIKPLDPMRDHNYQFTLAHFVEDRQIIGPDPEFSSVSEPAVMVARDVNDIRRSDLMVVNLLNNKSKGIGSLIEFGIAYELGIPIITVISEEDSKWEHSFVLELSTAVVTDMRDAVDLIEKMLSP